MTAAPTVYVTLEPPLPPAYGPELVSAETTRTWSGDRPKAAAAMTAKPEFTPLMSTADVTTVIVPSEFDAADGGCGLEPSGPVPCRHPDPFALRKGVARCPERVLADPLEHLPHADDGRRVAADPDVPLDDGVLRRSSMGSSSSAFASSSRSDSSAKAAVGAPGGAVGAEREAVRLDAVAAQVVCLPVVRDRRPGES